MKPIPAEYLENCANPGKISEITYGRKKFLLYTPIYPSGRILYLIHGGGGDEHSFFRPAFRNMVDHMIAKGDLEPMYIVTPCFYDPDETDKTPGSSGVAVRKFGKELREEIIPLAEKTIGISFDREHRAISGFSMGGVTTWYAMLQSLDLFYWFLPLSGDCWACGEKGGGDHPQETADELAAAVERQGCLDFRIHALTGSKDIAYPNLDPQIQAMRKLPIFADRLRYDVLEDGVHDYETIFRYLFNALPRVFIPTYDLRQDLYIPASMGKLYGVFQHPDKAPALIILSHGFNGNHMGNQDFADFFTSQGFATFCLDFCGGGMHSRSEGRYEEMSVLTEAEDLSAVIDYFRPQFPVIFLWGASQGGFISSCVAAKRPGDVKAMAIEFPAYVLQEDSRKRLAEVAAEDGTIPNMGVQISRKYNLDAVSFDIYDVLPGYTGDVLIQHGDQDRLVPQSYSERAAKAFPAAELIILPGEGHGFRGRARQEAMERELAFFRKHL